MAVFEAFVLGEGGVEFGLEEGEELVEEVDAKRVADYMCIESVPLCQKTRGLTRVEYVGVPIYQPWAMTIRRKKITRKAPVADQR